MGRFDGRTAVVTGASRGIGLAIAQRLVDEGAKVLITARNQDGLDEAVARLGDNAIGVAGKADDPDHRERVFATALGVFGGLDYLVNNAGINPAYGPALQVAEEAARKIFEVNVLGTLAWSRDAVAAGLTSSIVNIASIAGLHAAPGIAVYGISKGAVITMTTQLAQELAPDIRVNAVAPAVIKTRFAAALYEGHEEQAAAAYPLGRLGEPEDVAGPVAFLLSDDASWITGQTLVIDGGVSVSPAI